MLAIVACGGGGGEKSSAEKQDSTTATQPESTTTTEPQPDHTPKVAALGETVTWRDLQFVVYGTKIPISFEGKIFQPVPGTVVIGVDVEIKNPTTETRQFPPALTVYDAQHRAFNQVGVGGVEPKAPGGDILPNGAKRGLFTFQVLDGAQGPGLRMVFLPEPSEPAIVIPLVPGDVPPVPKPVDTQPGVAHPLGEAGAVGDAVIVVNGIENPFTPEEEYGKAKPGNRWVVVDLSVFNAGKPNLRGSRIDASIQDAQNQTFSASFSTPKKFPEGSLEESVPPGFGRRGPAAFEIPEASAGPGMKLLLKVRGSEPVVFQLT
jgi:hypothetical protein